MSREKVPSGICEKKRLRSACASAQSDLSIFFSQIEFLIKKKSEDWQVSGNAQTDLSIYSACVVFQGYVGTIS